MKKVLLLMSGGVDSSVAAALLLNQGYSVTGVTMNLHGPKSNVCSTGDISDAALVAKKLGIDHFVVDVYDDFVTRVIDNFANEYLAGKTPNPCVVCNKYIKFGKMFDIANNLGFDYIATGHYAVVEHDTTTGKWTLKKATSRKDQSYVLYSLDQEKLSRVLFPVAGFSKDEIRKIARDYHFPVSEKKDSQDICFVNSSDYSRFVEEYTGYRQPTGMFIDTNGTVLGKHNGIMHYTIGQRKGLGISFGKPTYVVSLNADSNTVTLGDEPSLYSDCLVATDLNFISGIWPDSEIEICAKVRYSANCARAKLSLINSTHARIVFYEKQRAITPGQAVVFYDGDIVLGGGTIASIGN